MNVTTKVAAGAAGAGAGSQLAIVLVWLLGLCHVAMPVEVAAALSGLLATVAGGYLGWLVPHAQAEIPS